MINKKTQKSTIYLELVWNHGENVNTWFLFLAEKKMSNSVQELH